MKYTSLGEIRGFFYSPNKIPYLYCMLIFYVNEKTSKGKSLLKFAMKLNAPSSSVRIQKNRKPLTDEDMALPGYTPTKKELEEWLDLPDKGKGSPAETVRKRLIRNLRKEFPSKK